MISTEVRTAFSNYVALTVAELSAGQAPPDSAPVLLEKVGTLEGTDVFRNLIDATQRAFPAGGIWIVNLWESELGNFFRRTAFYEDVLAETETCPIDDETDVLIFAGRRFKKLECAT